ncbi:hypothetical protein EI555_003173 [Monodon monoceros]|uniref:Uncharacterized protein n=1 Tax=Monodon monoceros TaxID=40151 RepID=A0A4U1FLZ1_MONMO|nr:hypothetical protein EI555_003173 [Monodon monoceros]
MELRPDTSHKENVPPRPATPLGPLTGWSSGSAGHNCPLFRAMETPEEPGQYTWPVGARGPGREQGGCHHTIPGSSAVPGALPSPEQPDQPQPGPRPEGHARQLTNSSFRQQSNLQPLAGRPQGRPQAFAIQQSDLSVRETSHARGKPSTPRATGFPSLPPEVVPAAVHQYPLPRHWARCRPGPARRAHMAGPQIPVWLVGEPLILGDLAAPAQSRTRAPSQVAIHQLLASVQRLEREAVRLRCQAPWEPPGPVQQESWTGAGQILPAHPQPSQPVLASWDERRKHSQGFRETAGFPEAPGVQDGLSDSQASSKPASLETTLEMLPGVALDPEQGVLPGHPVRRGEKCSTGTTYGRGQREDPLLPQGAGSREARLCSSASSSSAQGILPGQEGGDRTPREQVGREEERPASGLPDTAPVRSALQNFRGREGPKDRNAGAAAPGNPKPELSCLGFPRLALHRGKFSRGPASSPAAAWSITLHAGKVTRVLLSHQLSLGLGTGPIPWSAWSVPSRQWLSRCFRACRHWAQRRRAMAAAMTLGCWQLLRRGLRAPRWTLWLRQAQLEAVWGRHTQALLARTFQKWRNLIQQQKKGWLHIQAGPGPPSSGGGQDRDPSGRKPVVDTAWRSRWSGTPQSKESEGGGGSPAIPLCSGPRPEGGDRGVQILQAVFLLWCHQKEWARQEKGVQGEASGAVLRAQRMERPPPGLVLSCCRCSLGVPTGHPVPEGLALQVLWGLAAVRAKRDPVPGPHGQPRAGTLRMCLQQWVQTKQLQASDGAKGTWPSSAQPLGGATAHGLGVVAQAQALPREQGWGSLQEAGRKLALHRALLLWRTQLSQRQRAEQVSSFFEGVQQRALRHSLRGWRLRAWDPGSARTTLAPAVLGGVLGGEALPGRRTPRSSLEQASRAPALLEAFRVSLCGQLGGGSRGSTFCSGRRRPSSPRARQGSTSTPFRGGGGTCSAGALRHCFAGSGVPCRPGPGSCMAALGRCSGDGVADADAGEVAGRERQQRGWGLPGRGQWWAQLKASSQWHLRRAWRRWALRLQVSQRLQQQQDGWVHSQNPFFFGGGVSSVRESSLDSRALNPAGDRVLSTVVAVTGPGTGLACGTAAAHTTCVGPVRLARGRGKGLLFPRGQKELGPGVPPALTAHTQEGAKELPAPRFQAFETWHQRLAARGLRGRASSSGRPRSRQEATRAPVLGGLGVKQGAQQQL